MVDSLLALVTNSNKIEWWDAALAVIVVVVYVLLGIVWPKLIAWPVIFPYFWFVYRTRVLGREHIPRRGPALLVCNHVTRLDWVLLVAACRGRHIRFLTEDSDLSQPILGWFLRWARIIPIDRTGKNPRAVVAGLKQAVAALQEGLIVCVFAEGYRTRNGFLGPFHRGFERILKDVDVPVLPVYISGMWGSLLSYFGTQSQKKKRLTFRRRITIGFGAPLPRTVSAPEVRQAVQRLAARCAIAMTPQRRLVHSQFVRSAAHRPFRPCFIDVATKRELNYGKALAGAMVVANWLRPKLGTDAMVGLWLPSSMGGAIANIALALLGKTSVNLNYTASLDTLKSAVRQTGIRRIVTSRAFVKRVPLEVPGHEGPPTDGQVEFIYLEDAAQAISKTQRTLAFLKILLLPGWLLDRFVLGLGAHKHDAIATVIFSSGSTGDPKGILLSHGNIAANTESMVQAIELDHNDRLLGVLPFFHSFGYTVTLWTPLQIGASTVFYPDPRQAKEIGELCRQHRCSIVLTTPTFLRYYLKRSEPDDFQSVRILITGAERLPPALADEFAARFHVRPLEGYGCTELAPAVAANVPDRQVGSHKQIGTRVGTIGQPLPGIAVKIVDPDTYEERPVGTDGLLLVTGANVMVGYLGRPDLTEKVMRDGWYATGDIGHVDADGFITLTGRLSRFAKVGGEMVPLERVEEELHAAIGSAERFAVVTAIPDEARGERMVILHLPFPDLEVQQVCKKLGERGLPNLWLPKERDFHQVTEFPVLGSGKLDLQRVKTMALERFRA